MILEQTNFRQSNFIRAVAITVLSTNFVERILIKQLLFQSLNYLMIITDKVRITAHQE